MAQAREKPDIEAIVKDPVKHFATPRDVVTEIGEHTSELQSPC